MGLFFALPKTAVAITADKGPASIEQLAEVESNILKLLDAFSERLSANEIEELRKTIKEKKERD